MLHIKLKGMKCTTPVLISPILDFHRKLPYEILPLSLRPTCMDLLKFVIEDELCVRFRIVTGLQLKYSDN